MRPFVKWITGFVGLVAGVGFAMSRVDWSKGDEQVAVSGALGGLIGLVLGVIVGRLASERIRW
jgi:membrane associated rhomboid family serine protease